MWFLLEQLCGRSYAWGLAEGGVSGPTGSAPVPVEQQKQKQAAPPAPAEEQTATAPPADQVTAAPIARNPGLDKVQQMVQDALRNPDKAKQILETDKKQAKQDQTELDKSQKSIGKDTKLVETTHHDRDSLAKDMAAGKWDGVQNAFQSFAFSLKHEDAQALQLMIYDHPPNPAAILKKVQELKGNYAEISSRLDDLLNTKITMPGWFTSNRPLADLAGANQAISAAEQKLKDDQASIKPLQDKVSEDNKKVEADRKNLELAKKYGEAQKQVESKQHEADDLAADLAKGNWEPVQKAFQSFNFSLRQEDAQALQLLLFATPPDAQAILKKIQELKTSCQDMAGRLDAMLDTKVVLYGPLGIDFLKKDRSLRELLADDQARDAAVNARDHVLPAPEAEKPPAVPAEQPQKPPAEQPQEPAAVKPTPVDNQTDVPTVPADQVPVDQPQKPPAADQPQKPPAAQKPPADAPETPVDAATPPTEPAAPPPQSEALKLLNALPARPDADQIDEALAAVIKYLIGPPRHDLNDEEKAAARKALGAEIAGQLDALPGQPTYDRGVTSNEETKWMQRALYLSQLLDATMPRRDIGDQANLTNFDMDGRFGNATRAELREFHQRYTDLPAAQAGRYSEVSRDALKKLLTGN